MTECSICLDVVENHICQTICGHTFHSYCIFKSLQRNAKCPMCRYPLMIQNEDTERNEIPRSFQESRDIRVREEIENRIISLQESRDMRVRELENRIISLQESRGMRVREREHFRRRSHQSNINSMQTTPLTREILPRRTQSDFISNISWSIFVMKMKNNLYFFDF